MPIRALCTICSDFFDHSRDVAAIHCGHTFHLQCLFQWFETAPSRTCPQCRIQVGKKSIINKLFFDLAQEEETVLDAEFLKNELDNTRAQLSQKEKEKRDCQAIIDSLRDMLEERNATVDSLQQALNQAEMLCSTLKKQMKFLEQQQDETKQAREEARRLRSKMKTMERIELLLQSQRPEVEEMIRDMGVGQSAVEQLAVYCVSLKKEYENLKESRKTSGELTDKLKKDLFSSKSKLQAAYCDLDQAKLELKSAQKDLQSADKEITSLKKKLTMLQETLNLPPADRETVDRLVLESNSVEDISKKMPSDAVQESPLCLSSQHRLQEPAEELASAFPVFIRNSVLGRKQPLKKRIESSCSTDGIRTGFDGFGGRTKFIQPSDSPVIRSRPLLVKPKAKAKPRVRAKTMLPSSQAKLDTYLW
ncbi:E3 ubiquitin-protein ligase TRAIP isoform X3 [Sorex araneus]|uniref:E3 ubiquitin-protein ligase TRAIP isoform X3 n=1 Tax=Sorex araneus TaxID=42254 RepID=UPI0024336E52|nr:E3 ubiquitin-protein ligase TRAIP isoform X3 [Sorex araneus]